MKTVEWMKYFVIFHCLRKYFPFVMHFVAIPRNLLDDILPIFTEYLIFFHLHPHAKFTIPYFIHFIIPLFSNYLWFSTFSSSQPTDDSSSDNLRRENPIHQQVKFYVWVCDEINNEFWFESDWGEEGLQWILEITWIRFLLFIYASNSAKKALITETLKMKSIHQLPFNVIKFETFFYLEFAGFIQHSNSISIFIHRSDWIEKRKNQMKLYFSNKMHNFQ